MIAQNEPLFLEDLSVGQRFASSSHRITTDEIIAFASEFDPQPFHTNEKAAENTFFQGLAASGWHTAAITMRLLVKGALPLAGGAIGLSGEISWPRPVRPGDTLTVETEIIEITPSRSKPHQGIVTVRSVTHNQNNEIVQIFTSKVLAFRRGYRPGTA